MRRPAPSSLVFAAVLLFSIPHASPSPSPFFPNCSQSFSCGSLQNISYPFTGGPRPVYCGPPGFRLRCTDDSFPELLSASTLSFRLLELNPVLQRMTLSRSDLYNSPCIHRFINTTLNPAVFYPYGPDNVNLTLFYGCAPASYKPMPIDIDSFSCSDDGSSGFYFVGPFPYPNEALRCNVSVTVPLSMIATDDLKTKNSSLQEVLTKGFVVTYRDLYAAECRQCRDSGGDCGFSGGPICICGDTLCQRTGSKTKTIVGLGLGIGAAAILLLCGWGSFMIHSKGRRKAAGSSSMDRGLPTSDASKTTKTPSLHLSDLTNISYPPYAFTNSDTGSTYFGAQVFSYLELVEATDTFNPCKELGDGGFGTVYFGVLRDGREVAVKRLYENTVKRVEQFLNEVEILTRLRHPNLVALYGCTSRHSRELLLVYEYVPNGTLADHLHGKLGAKGSLPWSVRLSVAIETANALAYLHASGTIHRDVKSTNILLDTNFHVKVADFGLSRLFPDDVTHVSTAPQGTPGYVDPEYYQIYQLTSKSDVYSFGVVLMELISAKAAVDMGRHRHDINLATMAIKRIQNHALHELVDPSLRFENDYAVRSMVTSVAELAFRCVQTQSEVRPSMEEVVEALQEIHKEELGAQKAEVVDIDMDMVLAKQIMSPPLSPDKVACSDMKRVITNLAT